MCCPRSLAWTRLAYDELLAGQLALALVRAHMRRQAGRGHAGEGRLRARILKALPYVLTHSQQKALDDIVNDLALPQRMLRLLQGDVGSGKTVVALLAAATVIEAGRQAAFMAPTELLARQHLKTIAPLAEAAGLKVAILTGRERGGERTEILDRLALGDIDLLLGTHALFQDVVNFRDLGLAIVDEQHRFGVHQRLALTQKGDAVDVLVLTATPIPRTLVLTFFGDMDVSELREKPVGRQPIDTRIIPMSRIAEVEDAAGRALKDGNRVYWVCPLVDESEKIDLAAAEARFVELKEKFGARIDLVHGRMKGADKDAAMARFAAGETQLLVATTVIEVGVDVPEATIMVVEHAERFGLAQLHQLRGRIGRGTGHSTCLLLYKAPLGETAKARLNILRETEDGFRIAEEDLRLRGEGDVLGTRQSGLPGFHIARLEFHGKYLGAARDDAALILVARRQSRHAARRGAAASALSVREGRGDPPHPRRLNPESMRRLACRQRIGAIAVRSVSAFKARPDDQQDDADAGEHDEQPPRRAVDVVQAPRRHCKPGQQQNNRSNHAQRIEIRIRKHRDVENAGDDRHQHLEQCPIPVFRARGAAAEGDVIAKTGRDCFGELHDVASRMRRRT